jgi:hypothetical protein
MRVIIDVASAKRSNESARSRSKMLKLTAWTDIPREIAEMAITAVRVARWKAWNIVAVVRGRARARTGGVGTSMSERRSTGEALYSPC